MDGSGGSRRAGHVVVRLLLGLGDFACICICITDVYCGMGVCMYVYDDGLEPKYG